VVAEDRVVGPVLRGQRGRVAALHVDPATQVADRLPARRDARLVPLDAVGVCGAEDLQRQAQPGAAPPRAELQDPAAGHRPAQPEQERCLDAALDQRTDA